MFLQEQESSDYSSKERTNVSQYKLPLCSLNNHNLILEYVCISSQCQRIHLLCSECKKNHPSESIIPYFRLIQKIKSQTPSILDFNLRLNGFKKIKQRMMKQIQIKQEQIINMFRQIREYLNQFFHQAQTIMSDSYKINSMNLFELESNFKQDEPKHQIKIQKLLNNLKLVSSRGIDYEIEKRVVLKLQQTIQNMKNQIQGSVNQIKAHLFEGSQICKKNAKPSKQIIFSNPFVWSQTLKYQKIEVAQSTTFKTGYEIAKSVIVLAEPPLSNQSTTRWRMKIDNFNDYVSVGIIQKQSAIKHKFMFKNQRQGPSDSYFISSYINCNYEDLKNNKINWRMKEYPLFQQILLLYDPIKRQFKYQLDGESRFTVIKLGKIKGDMHIAACFDGSQSSVQILS